MTFHNSKTYHAPSSSFFPYELLEKRDEAFPYTRSRISTKSVSAPSESRYTSWPSNPIRLEGEPAYWGIEMASKQPAPPKSRRVGEEMEKAHIDHHNSCFSFSFSFPISPSAVLVPSVPSVRFAPVPPIRPASSSVALALSSSSSSSSSGGGLSPIVGLNRLFSLSFLPKR